MMFPRLLAKSSRTPNMPREQETLAAHLVTVTRVSTLLAETWGPRYLGSLGLDPEAFGSQLRVVLPRAALAHDFGKGNDHFQRMLRRDRMLRAQAARHEQVSVWLLLRFDQLRRWLFEDCSEALQHAALIAVLGHHVRLEDGSDIRLRPGSGARRLDVLSGHHDFRIALKAGAALLDLADPPTLSDVAIDLVEPQTFDEPMQAWARGAYAWWKGAGAQEQRFVAALKALVVAADVGGSAIPRMPADPLTWSHDALAHVCGPADLEQVVADRLRGSAPRPFQENVASSPSRVTFVRAGCGSGKTAAAYLWAARRAGGRKLFVCYPTTGTASQGFADYVPPDQFDAALVHSRAAADIEDLLSSGSGDSEDRVDWLTRYAALVTWDAPITVCTVDTVLGLMQNNRAGLFSFPSIANGAFVFDEIHQYDDRLFETLLRFLATFRGAPTLLMTASLPRARLRALERIVACLAERLTVVRGPANFESLKRYRVERSDTGRAWTEVETALDLGKRVLWVVNTVDGAVAVAKRAEANALPTLPYHSRYRYQDRLMRHGDVVRAFTGAAGDGVLAVTTQVCEVSLDLSADLLVTDLAPIAALIQRLGRLNRRAEPGTLSQSAPAMVLEPSGPEPYDAAELDDARRWLRLLGAAPISQAELAAAFDEVQGDALAPRSATGFAWLDGGVLASRAPLREEGMTIPVVRAEDAKGLRGLGNPQQNRQLIRVTIPMPLGPVAREIGTWQRCGGALVAPLGSLVYDDRFGGTWR